MAKGKPIAVKLPTDFVINMAKDVKVLEGNNVVGYIEGKSKKDEYIVVSAHYDHLGKEVMKYSMALTIMLQVLVP